MKSASLVILLSFVSAGLFAAVVDVQVNLSVTLAASPGTVTLGSPVTLTATPSLLSPKLNPQILWRAVPEHIRYTFTAQRTWPCATSVVIATNVATKTVTWNPSAAGVYDISVKAVYSIPATPVVKGADTIRVNPTGATATASQPNYNVKPQAGWSGYVKADFNPPSPAIAPVNLYLSVSVNFSPEYTWYRYTYSCAGCSPGTQTKDHVTAATFQMNIANPGSYIFGMAVDKVVQYPGQDCRWEQSVQLPHLDPAYYYVNAAP
jgi:hypothetical protein